MYKPQLNPTSSASFPPPTQRNPRLSLFPSFSSSATQTRRSLNLPLSSASIPSPLLNHAVDHARHQRPTPSILHLASISARRDPPRPTSAPPRSPPSAPDEIPQQPPHLRRRSLLLSDPATPTSCSATIIPAPPEPRLQPRRPTLTRLHLLPLISSSSISASSAADAQPPPTKLVRASPLPCSPHLSSAAPPLLLTVDPRRPPAAAAVP